MTCFSGSQCERESWLTQDTKRMALQSRPELFNVSYRTPFHVDALTLVLLDRDNLANRSLNDSHIPGMSRELQLQPANAGFIDPYPLSNPPRARPTSAIGKFGANPNTSILSAVPASPVRRTGFLPTLSLIRPQATPDKNSAKANAEVTIPT